MPNDQQQPLVLQDGSQLDPKIVKVMRAIRHVESGGDYNAVGDNGQSHGAFQWNKDHFQNQASSFGLDPSDFSRANQNKVAYMQIKKYKDQGYDPEEIAALWNGAKRDPMSGRLTYVNPEYGVRFRAALQGGQAPSANPGGYPTQNLVIPPGVDTSGNASNDQQDPTLGQQLRGRANDAANAINKDLNGNIISGPLQFLGAGAGAVGDVIGAGLNLIPGVKQIEQGIGAGVQQVAQTPAGQQVVGAVNGFQQQHPELSADIGALGNIAMLASGGVGGKVGKEAVEQGVKKTFTKAAEGTFGDTLAGMADRSAERSATNLLKTNPTEKEIKQAIAEGRLTKNGILPSAAKRQQINETKGLIKKGVISRSAPATTAAPTIHEAGTTESKAFLKSLEESKAKRPISQIELQGFGRSVTARAAESASSGESAAGDLLRVFQRNLPKDGPIMPEDILKARRAVSRYIEANKGDWRQGGVLTGFNSARDAFTDESRRLLQYMAPDVDVIGSLKKQESLFKAAKSLAPAVKAELAAQAKKTGTAGLIKKAGKAALHYGLEGAGFGLATHFIP